MTLIKKHNQSGQSATKDKSTVQVNFFIVKNPKVQEYTFNLKI